MSKFPVIKIKCKDCPYYTGVQCHGHGEFWGECTLYDDKSKVLKKMFETESTYFRHINVWSLVRYDDSVCTFFELDDFGSDDD